MLHTLGNLTLTGYNSEYSDRPFREKKTMDGGFVVSPLRLNEGLGQTPVWNKQSIEKRADKLAKLAKDVWSYPDLSDVVLSKYKEQPKALSVNTLDNFDYLQNGKPSRKLFDAIRKEILAIDSVVYEEILKYYIAYKAETNFVDIVPLADSLSLALNMPFENLYDPEGVALNVAGLGHWGNGEVEVKINSVGQIPYALSLINQSFEHQMGNGRGEE